MSVPRFSDGSVRGVVDVAGTPVENRASLFIPIFALHPAVC